jgi:hypothetical protein
LTRVAQGLQTRLNAMFWLFRLLTAAVMALAFCVTGLGMAGDWDSPVLEAVQLSDDGAEGGAELESDSLAPPPRCLPVAPCILCAQLNQPGHAAQRLPPAPEPPPPRP